MNARFPGLYCTTCGDYVSHMLDGDGNLASSQMIAFEIDVDTLLSEEGQRVATENMQRVSDGFEAAWKEADSKIDAESKAAAGCRRRRRGRKNV